ncbi:MAG: hypothetical protein ABIO79_04815 [Ferruginibacter sp.]
MLLFFYMTGYGYNAYVTWIKASYIFRNDETLKTNIIVLVALKQRPIINCSLNALQ